VFYNSIRRHVITQLLNERRQRKMAGFSWSLQIYAVSDELLQNTIADRLRDLDRVNVELATNGPNYFVIAECPDVLAQGMCDLVIRHDPLAMLVHETSGTDEDVLQQRVAWASELIS
jgi:hypothetical protein